MQRTPTLLKQASIAALMSGVLILPAVQATAADEKKPSTMATVKADVKETWKEGVIDGAFLFNSNLNPLDIDVDVHDSTAVLTGYVDSPVAKSLAREIALSVDGIEHVDNQLKVDSNKAKSEKHPAQGLAADVSDATITVKVKSKLLANTEVSGFQINVDTDNQNVTLKGKVNTEAERDLAYYITRNTEGVKSINNELVVVDFKAS